MAPTYKYPNLKKETNSSGQVDLIKVKKSGKVPPKSGKTLRELVMEGFAEINKQLAKQQQSINQLKIDSKNTKDLLIDVIKTNDLKVSNSELIEHEDSKIKI
ncbi:MAG: hypothetical protein PUI87_02170 [Mycoplasmataceae bacterium]|nr:hypothetical protein [Mycoplasmataceae bacterium]